MSDKKNIVIKVKYPTPGKSSEKVASTPGMITEWNVKRIGLALSSLLLGVFMLIYFTDSDDHSGSLTEQLAVPEQTVETNKQSTANIRQPQPAKPLVEMSRSVIRSQLTSEIKKNEPVDSITVPLKIGKKETIWIYYFAELKGLKGRTIFHEWLLNGDLVSQKKVNISADPWRTASKQMITYTTNNDWSVRLVDDAGNQLIEKKFNLELK